jgi:hypothetical protein
MIIRKIRENIIRKKMEGNDSGLTGDPMPAIARVY